MNAYFIFGAMILIIVNALQAHENYNIRSPSVNEASPDNQPHAYREVQAEALNKFVHLAHPKVVIVDARAANKDEVKRIKGSKSIPFNSSVESITEILPDKSATIVVYCSHARCSASQLLADRLIQLGYQNVWKYPGGLEEWEAKGLDVEQGKPTLPNKSMSPEKPATE